MDGRAQRPRPASTRGRVKHCDPRFVPTRKSRLRAPGLAGGFTFQ